VRLRVTLACCALIALLACAAGAGKGEEGQPLRVIVVPGLTISDLLELQDRAAIGLVMPGAGPRVTEASALAALERGVVRNSRRGGLPEGEKLIEVETLDAIPAGGPAVILSLPQGGDQANDRRYPIAVIAPGFEGLLESPSTRIAGIVSVADVALAALGDASALSAAEAEDPVEELVALDARIQENGEVRAFAALLAGLGILLLAALVPQAALGAFGTVLLANLLLGVAGVSTPWLVLLVFGLALAAAVGLAWFVPSTVATGALLALTVAAYALVLAANDTAVALSPLGPTQNARFFGLSNLLSALLLVAALGAAVLLHRRFGWRASLAVLAGSLATFASGELGADGGGSLVLVAGVAFLVYGLTGGRVVAGLAAGAGGVALVAALVALDRATGTETHVTRAVGEGTGFLSALGDRAVLSFERATDDWYVALGVLVGIAVLAAVSALLIRLSPEVRALPLAIAGATAVSLAVNDSPLEVVAIGLVGLAACRPRLSQDPRGGAEVTPERR
jgi:hypothetical protein